MGKQNHVYLVCWGGKEDEAVDAAIGKCVCLVVVYNGEMDPTLFVVFVVGQMHTVYHTNPLDWTYRPIQSNPF